MRGEWRIYTDPFREKLKTYLKKKKSSNDVAKSQPVLMQSSSTRFVAPDSQSKKRVYWRQLERSCIFSFTNSPQRAKKENEFLPNSDSCAPQHTPPWHFSQLPIQLITYQNPFHHQRLSHEVQLEREIYAQERYFEIG